MTIYTFESNLHSDELITVTPEEMDEVFQIIAEEAEGYKALGEWSEEVEKPWLNGYSNRKPGPTCEGWDI